MVRAYLSEEVIFANWPIPCRLLVDYVDEWFSLYFIIYRCVVGFCVLNVIGAVRAPRATRNGQESGGGSSFRGQIFSFSARVSEVARLILASSTPQRHRFGTRYELHGP